MEWCRYSSLDFPWWMSPGEGYCILQEGLEQFTLVPDGVPEGNDDPYCYGPYLTLDGAKDAAERHKSDGRLPEDEIWDDDVVYVALSCVVRDSGE